MFSAAPAPPPSLTKVMLYKPDCNTVLCGSAIAGRRMCVMPYQPPHDGKGAVSEPRGPNHRDSHSMSSLATRLH